MILFGATSSTFVFQAQSPGPSHLRGKPFLKNRGRIIYDVISSHAHAMFCSMRQQAENDQAGSHSEGDLMGKVMYKQNQIRGHQVHYSKDQCYMCGKTEADLDMFRQQLLSRFGGELDTIQVDDLPVVINLKKILDDSYPTGHLHFKITTVKQDRESFSQMIPYLDELLAFSKYVEPVMTAELQEKDLSYIKQLYQQTLADIRNWLRKNPEMIYEHPDVKPAIERQKQLSSQKEKVAGTEGISFPLIEANCQHMTGRGWITISLKLCPVCHGLLRQASVASYHRNQD